MPRYEAYIENTWREHGLANVLVARIRDHGVVDYGFFLTDTWCLGVKDATAEFDVPETFLREHLDQLVPSSLRQPIHPACARKLIEGAVAYAESLGFSAHRDFRKARRVLSGIDAALCSEEFTFGREGRPCYFQGTADSDERARRILAILDARVGPDGYEFVSAADQTDEDEEDDDALALREELMEWLDAEPAEVPRFYTVSGMVTALHICPRPVPPIELIEALWHPEGRVSKNPEDVKRFTELLTAYWNVAGQLVHAAVAPDVPPGEQPLDLWPEDFPDDDPIPLAAAMMEWAGGFLRATEVWPEAWEGALERPDLAQHWDLIRCWANFADEQNRQRIADAAEGTPSRTIIHSVTALARALRPE